MKHEIRDKLKVLHVLPQSLPLSNGSTIRSKFIVEMQQSFVTPSVAVYPTFSKQQAEMGNPANINGIEYYYYIDNSHLRKKLYSFRLSRPLITQLHIRLFKKFLYRVVSEKRPDIIHAASPYVVGLPSIKVAKFLKVPFIFELRNFYELDVLSRRKFKNDGLRYRYRKSMENYLLFNADRVIAISENSRKEIISRGVNDNKVCTVHNGIDTNFFKPMEKDKILLRKFSLNNNYIIGFVGKLKRIEGLELMIKSFPNLLRINKNFILFIVGEGPEKIVLQKLATRMHLDKHILFVGQVPFNEIRKYYSLIDLFVVPRMKTKLADIISPLKPLEAMAMKIPVLGSDVGGMKELIKNGENGYIFRAGNLQDLSEKISFIMENKKELRIVAEKAFKWVVENRNWNKLIVKYKGIYHEVVSNKNYYN